MTALEKMRETFEMCTVMAGVEPDFECVYITKGAADALFDEAEAENAELRERIKELEECIRGDAEGIYRLAKNTGYLHTDELMKSINNRMRELGVEV